MSRKERQKWAKTAKKREKYQIECKTEGRGASVVIFMKSHDIHATLDLSLSLKIYVMSDHREQFGSWVSPASQQLRSSCMYAAGGDR